MSWKKTDLERLNAASLTDRMKRAPDARVFLTYDFQLIGAEPVNKQTRLYDKYRKPSTQFPRSPETDVQHRFVREWARRSTDSA